MEKHRKHTKTTKPTAPLIYKYNIDIAQKQTKTKHQLKHQLKHQSKHNKTHKQNNVIDDKKITINIQINL